MIAHIDYSVRGEQVSRWCIRILCWEVMDAKDRSRVRLTQGHLWAKTRMNDQFVGGCFV